MTVVIENSTLNCWDNLACPPLVRDKCVVYTSKSGHECWYFMTIKEKCPHQDPNKGCLNCQFFQRYNPNF